MKKFRVLDLFSGIGGFSLGLERAGGFETVAFCEIEEYPRKVLAKHWPGVPIYEDVRTLTADTLARDGIAVDVICGGFPCQDISFAGRRAGLEGARSGLWSEYARLIGELRPRFVIVENVPGLLSLGMGTVLGDMAALGYDATWDCIPACAIGAPHRRDRVWIVGHTDDKHGGNIGAGGDKRGRSASSTRPLHAGNSSGDDVANAERWRLQSGHEQRAGQTTVMASKSGWDCGGGKLWSAWGSEPDLGRVAYGLPNQVDRLKGLGNAVVPQIPELIGRAIMQAEGMTEFIEAAE